MLLCLLFSPPLVSSGLSYIIQQTNVMFLVARREKKINGYIGLFTSGTEMGFPRIG